MKTAEPFFIMAIAANAIRREVAKLAECGPRVCNEMEPEAIHQMRASLRRVEVAVALLGRSLPELCEAARLEATWVSEALAELRDLDVLQERVERWESKEAGNKQRGLHSVLAAIEERRPAAREQARNALISDRYRALMSSLDRLVSHAPDADTRETAGAQECRAIARHYLKRVRRKGLRANGHIKAKRLHRVRLRNKELREILELFAPYLGADVRPFLEATSRLHDALGRHQDAHVGLAYLRKFRLGRPGISSAVAAVLQDLEGRYGRVADKTRRRAIAAYRSFERQPWRKLVGRTKGAGGQTCLSFLPTPSMARSTA